MKQSLGSGAVCLPWVGAVTQISNKSNCINDSVPPRSSPAVSPLRQTLFQDPYPKTEMKTFFQAFVFRISGISADSIIR